MGEARYGSDEARGASELRKQRMTNDAATNVAKWTTSTFLTTLGIAALSVAIAVAPAEAKKQKSPADAHISDLDSGDPLFLVVSTGSQKVDIYRGTQLVVTSQVSTGMPAHPTFLGAFSILEKQRWHHSNIYSGAPMPWMNRITWSGTALHAGIVPGYPASHGCIRLPYSFAPKLYDITSVGDNVVISRDRPAPALIEHPNLFQPLPPPAMVKQEQTKQKQSTNDLLILPLDADLPHKVKLAKAEIRGVTTDVPSEDLGTDDTSHATLLPKAPVGAQNAPAAPAPAASTAVASEAKPAATPAQTVGAVVDTRTHAFDPLVGAIDNNTNHAVGSAASAHALDSDNEDGPAPVAAAPAAKTPAQIAAAPVQKTAAPIAAASAAETPALVVAVPKAETPAPAAFIMSPTTASTPAAEKILVAPIAGPVPAPEAAVAPAAASTVPAAAAPVVAATAAGIAPAAALVASLVPALAPVKPVPAAPVIAAGIAPAAIIAASVAPAPAPVAAKAPEVAAVIPAATPAVAAAPADSAPELAAPAAAAPVMVAAVADDNISPTAAENRLDAGTRAAALQAAEPRSTAPLRILVTRRTQRNRTVDVQNVLADLGYLDRVDFDGKLGKATVTAIKAFQKANGLPETGAFNDALADKVYAVAGKGQPPVGHIFVRQEFGRVFDAPIGLKNPEEPLGTHVYTALKFAPGDTKARWMTVTVQGGPAEEALDRIEIPDDIRQRISERLTPGSTLIIGDTSINAAGLPKGGDFVVLAKYGSPKTSANSSASDDGTDQPKKKRSVRRKTYNYNYGFNIQRDYQQQQRTFRSNPGWPW
jgi:lipoprotein-anchoring transpeptidase ErfK/SrfK/peptidoglycan hydrolase-like protein with peptidoglycan-binding domain